MAVQPVHDICLGNLLGKTPSIKYWFSISIHLLVCKTRHDWHKGKTGLKNIFLSMRLDNAEMKTIIKFTYAWIRVCWQKIIIILAWLAPEWKKKKMQMYTKKMLLWWSIFILCIHLANKQHPGEYVCLEETLKTTTTTTMIDKWFFPSSPWRLFTLNHLGSLSWDEDSLVLITLRRYVWIQMQLEEHGTN